MDGKDTEQLQDSNSLWGGRQEYRGHGTGWTSWGDTGRQGASSLSVRLSLNQDMKQTWQTN